MAKFQKGQSGNPQGRPRGAKATASALRADLITDEDLQAIVDVVIGKAKEGDLTAAGMILDRRLPRLRVTADFGLEKDNLAEQLKAARERVAAASRPVLQVVTGVTGGLEGGPDSPEDCEGVAPAPAATPVPQEVANARDEPPVAPTPPQPPHPQAIRLGALSAAETNADFDPYL